MILLALIEALVEVEMASVGGDERIEDGRHARNTNLVDPQLNLEKHDHYLVEPMHTFVYRFFERSHRMWRLVG